MSEEVDELEHTARQAEQLAIESAPKTVEAATGDPGQAAGTELVEVNKTPASNVAALTIIFSGIRVGGSKFLGLKSLDVTLCDENIEAVAKSLAPVLDKFGIRLGLIGDASEEFAALMTAGPILYMAYQGVMAELEVKKAQAAEIARRAQGGPVVAEAGGFVRDDQP